MYFSLDVVQIIFLYLSTLVYLYTPENLFIHAAVEELLAKGTRLLASSQLNEALSAYSQAVAEDPLNYLTYYRRGTAYLAMGNLILAKSDFDEAIRLNSGFVPALIQRANIYLKKGKLNEAKESFGILVGTYDEASERIEEIAALEEKLTIVHEEMNDEKFENALSLLDPLIEVMNFDPHLRELRADCYFKLGDVQKGIQEMKYAVHLTNDNREGLLKLSELMYNAGLVVQSLEEIRGCLRLDQNDKACMKHYKKIKKLAKAVSNAQDSLENSKYPECIENANLILQLEPSHPEYQLQAKILLCQCHAKSNSADGVEFCEMVASRFPQNIDFQCDLAESYINADKFDDGIRICQQILEDNRRHQRARDLLKRAQKLLKSSKRRDYYKILGVPRTATKKDIMKAYRKMAAKWHPDKFDGDSKKQAESKFVEISSAKEVLSNDEMRQRYDNGEDPLDPEQQQHQGPFGPFGGFSFANMHPFEGGHFEFHFG